ncbi:Transcriptional regulator [Amycolatopsis camponoti]|uniref:Transcriptional regulator n=1 Tax=Amycolatopsis camponoti TaxID=2606593 RepID=A0A6I8LUQ0_9PSEU|nr:LysR family transcriptional regulator [Amycolatopsis camponoti]VVJ20761.1 Transcriptional regulator [Amycolatopsis camponoti]
MDLDLRLVRYFTVVAEHLNFGRAAAALHLAQPSLSRQIQRLEHGLGVRLFDRTPQGSRLTEAGRAFLPQAQALLHSARQAELTARAAAPRQAITVGYVADLVITPAVRELRRRHPDARVGTRHLDWQDTHALPEHRVDALVVRLPLPFRTDQLRVTVLHEEPRVLVVPRSHRLAGKESVTLDELADERFTACTSSPTLWSGPLEPSLDDSFEDKLELVADGRGLAILPAGDRRPTVRADLATVPVEGIDPCQVVLATRADDPNPLAIAFHDVAASCLA